VQIDFAYRPIPVHSPFHASRAYERALFGAFGSGKTYGICAEAIAWALEQPGIRGLVTRRTVPELRDTTETVFFELLPDELYRADEVRRAGGHVERFIFPNGSEVLFRSIDDWNKHKSLNVGFIAWDEADEFDEETYLGMSSRVRQREPTPAGRRYGATEITRRGMWCASNPSGHNWLYRRFIDPNTFKPNTAWWRSTSFDNPYLPPEYIESLLGYPEQWVRRYVLCQFDDFAGQIYPDWGWDTHVVEPSSIRPQPGSVFWMAMDPGTRSPTAGLWVYVDQPARTLYGIAEYQENYTSANEHAQAWRAIEAKNRMKVDWRVSDPGSLPVRDRGSNMSLQDQYRRLGFNFTLGPRRHVDRIPMLGQLIHMKRFKVTRNCPQAYEQIKNYKWEEITPAMRTKGVDPPERPLKKDDHLVDCAQYLSSRWVRPMAPRARPREETFSQEVYRTIRKNLREKRIAHPSHDIGVVV
jgi:PBSX family phage terminase large subunit